MALRLDTWGWVAVVLIFVPKDAFREPKRMMTGDQRQYKVAAKTRFDLTVMEKPLGPKKIEQFFRDYR